MSYLVKRITFVVIALTFTTGLVGYLLISQGINRIYASNTNSIHGASGTREWPMYQGNLGRTGFNAAETTITPANASQLILHWKNTAGGGISSQVAAANGLLYWGSWDGIEHATNLSGVDVWTANLGQTTDAACDPPSVGVASTATVNTVKISGVPKVVVFVGGGNGIFYALDANTGAVIWQVSLGTPPAYFLWGSPILYRGSVYEGISSFGDCPLVRGAVVKMNVATGIIQDTFYTMPAGCFGGSVWGSPTFDTTDGSLYIVTGNGQQCNQAGQMFLSIIKLNASDLSLIQFWQLPPADRFHDNDFGATPMLFNATIGGVTLNMVGVLNKNSIYYAFDRTNIGQGPVWETQLGNLGSAENISSSAWDGTTLYVAGGATNILDTNCQGSVNALNPADGTFIWRDCLTAERVLCPIVAAPGLLIIGEAHNLTVLDASSGGSLFNFVEPIQGGIFRAPIISKGIIYVGNSDGNLEAFGL